MKGLFKVNVTTSLSIGSRCICADNSGAKIAQIIGVYNKNNTKKRRRSAGVGDIVAVTVKQGKFDLRKKVHRAVIVRQKQAYFRKIQGYRIKFVSNALVLLNPESLFIYTSLKGPIAKEAIERVPSLIGKGGIVV